MRALLLTFQDFDEEQQLAEEELENAAAVDQEEEFAQNGAGIAGAPMDVIPMAGHLDGEGQERKERTTTPYLTKYERARVLGTRALQIRWVGIDSLFSDSSFFLPIPSTPVTIPLAGYALLRYDEPWI